MKHPPSTITVGAGVTFNIGDVVTWELGRRKSRLTRLAIRLGLSKPRPLKRYVVVGRHAGTMIMHATNNPALEAVTNG